MRYSILKKHSTKSERRVYEVLKELKIPFKHRWMICGKEADFVIGKTILEIDGHLQTGNKNQIFVEAGYTPLHLTNEEVKDTNKLRTIIKQL